MFKNPRPLPEKKSETGLSPQGQAGFLANISIAWKMGLMVAVLFLGMAGITVSAYSGIQSLRYQFSNMHDFMLVPITSIEEADTALVGSQYYLVQVLREDITAAERANGVVQIQADNQSAEKVIARYDTEWVTTTSPQFTQDLTNAGKLDLQKQEVATLAAYHAAYAAYDTAVAKYLVAVQAGKPDAALANETITNLEAAHIELRKLIDVNNQFADFSNTSAQAAIQRALLDGGIALGISVLLGFLMSYLVVISITGRLAGLIRAAAALQAGNLDQTVAEAGHDEIALLGKTFNKMTAQLSEFIRTLEQHVAERTKALATVAEVSRATATILQTDRLLQEVVDLTKERFHLYHSHIYLLDKAGENLVLASGAGEPGRQMMAKGFSIALNREQSLVARAARERKGVAANDVTQAPDFLPNPLLPDTRSELAVPMIAGGNVIGVFDIQSDAVGRFTESDISIQTTLAAQVAISLQNARSFEQSNTQAELETLVNAIGQKIQRTTTVEDTLQTAIRELGLAIGASRVKASIQAAHPDTPERKNTGEVEYV